MTVEVLADHPVWLAVPAFAPAIVVAGVVVYIAVKNRRRSDAPHSGDIPGSARGENSTRSNQDGNP